MRIGNADNGLINGAITGTRRKEDDDMTNNIDELHIDAFAALNDRNASVMETGATLNELKNAVPHGRWGDYMKEHDLPTRKIQMFLQVFDRFRHMSEYFQNTPLAVMRELTAFDDDDIVNRQLDRLTVRELRKIRETGELPPERPHRNPMGTRTESIQAAQPEQPATYTMEPAQPSDHGTDRIDELERRVSELESQMRLIVQLLK